MAPSLARISRRHLVVVEHVHLSNSKYVLNNCDYYNFGQSEILSLANVRHMIIQLLDKMQRIGEVVLIRHSVAYNVS